jgi:hypothetical protein
MEVVRKSIGENAEEISIDGRLFRVHVSRSSSGSTYVARCEVFDSEGWTKDDVEMGPGWSDYPLEVKRSDPRECFEAAVVALIEKEQRLRSGA